MVPIETLTLKLFLGSRVPARRLGAGGPSRLSDGGSAEPHSGKYRPGCPCALASLVLSITGCVCLSVPPQVAAGSVLFLYMMGCVCFTLCCVRL